MVVRKVTKYLSLSLVSSGLMFGLASVAHAQSSVTIENQNSSLVQSDNSQNDVDHGQSSSSNSSTVVQVQSNEGSLELNHSDDSSVGGDSTVVEHKSNDDVATSQNKEAGATDFSDKGNIGHSLADGSLTTDKDAGFASVPTIVTANIQSELQNQQSLPISQTATFSQITPRVDGPALVAANTPSQSTPHVPVVPHKDLPVEGALAGLNDTLANVTMPLRSLSMALLAGANRSYPAGLIFFVSSIVIAALVIAGRFVDLLRASGYTNAARADALNAFSSFATHLKVSFALAYEPSNELAFFGVRNKVFNVPNSTKKGGECK